MSREKILNRAIIGDTVNPIIWPVLTSILDSAPDVIESTDDDPEPTV